MRKLLRRCFFGSVGLVLLHVLVVIGFAQQPEWSVTLVDAPVRIYPDLNRTPLATLPPGTPVQIMERRGEWFRISFRDRSLGDRVGFVRAEHIRPTGQNQQPAIVPAPTDRPQSTVTSPPPT